jgi:hypothetical protein
MPCYQPSSLPSGVTTTGRTSYRTEAECNQACKEGACCEGTTCAVKPQCQCQGAGKVFKGVGTVCTPNPCGCCSRLNADSVDITAFVVSVQNLSIQRVNSFTGAVFETYSFKDIPDGISYVLPRGGLIGSFSETCGYSEVFFDDDCASRPSLFGCGGSVPCLSTVAISVSSSNPSQPSAPMNLNFRMFDRIIPATAFNSNLNSCPGFDLLLRNLPSPCQPSAYPVTREFSVVAGALTFSGSIVVGLSP